jgi:hypothetical protein
VIFRVQAASVAMQAASVAMQTDGKEGLCIAARIVGFAKKSIF